MFTANAFVIYFTFGVPFAMLSIYFTTSKLKAAKAAWFAAHMLLWPAFAAREFVRQALRESTTIDPVKTLTIQNELHSRFVSVIPSTVTAAERRKLIFELDRFIALSNCMTETYDDPVSQKMLIHEIVRHPFPSISARCLNRKLLGQLSRHQMDAYRSIYKLVDEQGINLPNAISSELNLLMESNSSWISNSTIADNRLAA